MTQTKMYQPQVNNNNNINSALDCAESRTVRTINTKQLQQQQQTVKVPSISAAYVNGDVTPFASATDFITGHTVTRQKPATKVALTAEMQNAPLNCQTRSFRRMPMMKSYALLPIICIVILAQISTTTGRTLHGRKQILHSLENRLQHHKQLMQYERELAPIHSVQLHRRHHLHVRSTKMTCPDDFKTYLESVRNQSIISRKTLKDKLDAFTTVRFAQTSEEAFMAWSKHNLSLQHPYTHSYSRQIISNEDSHNFAHLEGKTMSEELLNAEINKIFTTFKILKSVFNDTVNDSNKQDWFNKYKTHYSDIINFLERTYTELTINENVAKNILNSSPISKINDETITPTYNRTAQVREWLIIVETLSFFEYLTKLCESLMQMCN